MSTITHTHSHPPPPSPPLQPPPPPPPPPPQIEKQNPLPPPSNPNPPPPNPTIRSSLLSLSRNRPPVRLTSEFDSSSSVFLHKISCKFLQNLAKLKFSFQNNKKGEVSEPQLVLTSKNLSLHYDFEDQTGMLSGLFQLAPGLQIKASQDLRAQQGAVAMVADIAGPAYKLELSSAVPFTGLPKATVKFPFGEASFEEREPEDEEMKRTLSVSGILKGHVLNGVCTAVYRDDNLNLRYLYKDDQVAFIPSVSLPSNVLSFAFKRRFGPSDKLSYLYNFDSNYWSAVYKHTVGKDYKLKAGYDSEARLGWASIWVGEEAGRAKASPMKMKVQLMLQVPRDDLNSSALMFRFKKRWDI